MNAKLRGVTNQIASIGKLSASFDAMLAHGKYHVECYDPCR